MEKILNSPTKFNELFSARTHSSLSILFVCTCCLSCFEWKLSGANRLSCDISQFEQSVFIQCVLDDAGINTVYY